jgi:hypothetical protein
LSTACPSEQYLRTTVVLSQNNERQTIMHSKRCLAASIIAAVENLRDAEGVDDFSFRIDVQNNVPLTWADGYLNDGTMTCSCGEYDVRRLFDMFDRDPAAAQEEASEMLKAGTLTPDNYTRLARRIALNDRDAEATS